MPQYRRKTVAGKGAQKRSQAVAIRCAKLREEGLSLSAISGLTGIPRDQVRARIALGKRLLSMESQP